MVQEDELLRDVAGPSTGSGQKFQRVESFTPEMYMDDTLGPLTGKVDTLLIDMERIKDQLKSVCGSERKQRTLGTETKPSMKLFRAKSAVVLCPRQSFFQSAVDRCEDVWHVSTLGMVGLMDI